MTRRFHVSAPHKEAGKNSLLFRLVITQAKSPTHKDKAGQVVKDLEEIKLEIELKDSETI